MCSGNPVSLEYLHSFGCYYRNAFRLLILVCIRAIPLHLGDMFVTHVPPVPPLYSLRITRGVAELSALMLVARGWRIEFVECALVSENLSCRPNWEAAQESQIIRILTRSAL